MIIGLTGHSGRTCSNWRSMPVMWRRNKPMAPVRQVVSWHRLPARVRAEGHGAGEPRAAPHDTTSHPTSAKPATQAHATDSMQSDIDGPSPAMANPWAHPDRDRQWWCPSMSAIAQFPFRLISRVVAGGQTPKTRRTNPIYLKICIQETLRFGAKASKRSHFLNPWLDGRALRTQSDRTKPRLQSMVGWTRSSRGKASKTKPSARMAVGGDGKNARTNPILPGWQAREGSDPTPAGLPGGGPSDVRTGPPAWVVVKDWGRHRVPR